MGLILLEALLALVILVAIVWWTMFSGRRKGELPTDTPGHCPPREADAPRDKDGAQH
ncbi:MAG: hypothetical protein LBI66_11520 [Burkholderiaceae bacterium]|jgi:hypothetical protein|nr:hypothetical protein [Burkholderiaceae bacterium]